MKIFISWSGARSHIVAQGLREWLPVVLHFARPWLSGSDIAAGDRWSHEIARELEQASFGILVMTPENIEAPWLLFEAGAISKAFTTSAVVPYLVDVEFSDLSGPLALFQAKRAEKSSTWELVTTINKKASEPVDARVLADLFEVLWPKLVVCLESLPPPEEEFRARPEREVLEDVVTSIRRVERKVESGRGSMFMGMNLHRAGIPLNVLVSDEIPGIEPGTVVRVVTDEDAIEDVAMMLGLDLDKYGFGWFLSSAGSERPIAREAGRRLAVLASRGEVHLYLRRGPSGAA